MAAHNRLVEVSRLIVMYRVNLARAKAESGSPHPAGARIAHAGKARALGKAPSLEGMHSS